MFTYFRILYSVRKGFRWLYAKIDRISVLSFSLPLSRSHRRSGSRVSPSRPYRESRARPPAALATVPHRVAASD